MWVGAVPTALFTLRASINRSDVALTKAEPAPSVVEAALLPQQSEPQRPNRRSAGTAKRYVGTPVPD